MGDPLPFETPPPPPPRGRAAPLVWALAALVLAAALLAAGWQYLEHRGAENDLAGARERLARLEEELAAAERDLGTERDAAGDLRSRVADLLDTVGSCRGSLRRLSQAWDSVIAALNAAARLDRGEAERFRSQANENRRRSATAARRCG